MARCTVLALVFLSSLASQSAAPVGSERAERLPSLAHQALSGAGKSAPQDQGATQEKREQAATTNSETPPEPPRIVVVTSSKNPIESLTIAELARIFLRESTQWPNGWSITVYERPVKEKIRQRFSKKVLGKKPEVLHEYWMNLKLTRGLKPPKVLRSATLVKRYLARVKGGIGYLYEHEIDETVKVIEIVAKES